VFLSAEFGELYELLSPSGSNTSAASLPSAFFNKISTRPSASSSCFWHSRERCTPSSNNFMASSSESCGLSSFRTTSSSRDNDLSKSGFFVASVFFGAGESTPVPQSPPISGSVSSSMSTFRPVQSAGSFFRSACIPFLRVDTRTGFSPVPETTTFHLESQAQVLSSILKHAGERTQSLCAVPQPLCSSMNPRSASDPHAPATAPRTSRCCQSPRSLSGPEETPSADAWTAKAVLATPW